MPRVALLNPEKCFVMPAPIPIPANPVVDAMSTEVFQEKFAELIAHIMGAEGGVTAEELVNEMKNKHLSRSVNNYADEMLAELKKFYKLLTKVPPPSLNDQKAAALKIIDRQGGIFHCSKGFFIRISAINMALTEPPSLDALKLEYRKGIMDKAAMRLQGIRGNQEVHNHNQVTRRAAAKYKTRVIAENDNFNIINSHQVDTALDKAFEEEYQPIPMLDSIINLMQAKLREMDYLGRQEVITKYHFHLVQEWPSSYEHLYLYYKLEDGFFVYKVRHNGMNQEDRIPLRELGLQWPPIPSEAQIEAAKESILAKTAARQHTQMGYLTAEFLEYIEYLQKILGKDLDYEDCLIHVDDNVVDLNWNNIKKALLKKFLDEERFSLIRSEKNLLQTAVDGLSNNPPQAKDYKVLIASDLLDTTTDLFSLFSFLQVEKSEDIEFLVRHYLEKHRNWPIAERVREIFLISQEIKKYPALIQKITQENQEIIRQEANRLYTSTLIDLMYSNPFSYFDFDFKLFKIKILNINRQKLYFEAVHRNGKNILQLALCNPDCPIAQVGKQLLEANPEIFEQQLRNLSNQDVHHSLINKEKFAALLKVLIEKNLSLVCIEHLIDCYVASFGPNISLIKKEAFVYLMRTMQREPHIQEILKAKFKVNELVQDLFKRDVSGNQLMLALDINQPPQDVQTQLSLIAYLENEGQRRLFTGEKLRWNNLLMLALKHQALPQISSLIEMIKNLAAMEEVCLQENDQDENAISLAARYQPSLVPVFLDALSLEARKKIILSNLGKKNLFKAFKENPEAVSACYTSLAGDSKAQKKFLHGPFEARFREDDVCRLFHSWKDASDDTLAEMIDFCVPSPTRLRLQEPYSNNDILCTIARLVEEFPNRPKLIDRLRGHKNIYREHANHIFTGNQEKFILIDIVFESDKNKWILSKPFFPVLREIVLGMEEKQQIEFFNQLPKSKTYPSQHNLIMLAVRFNPKQVAPLLSVMPTSLKRVLLTQTNAEGENTLKLAMRHNLSLIPDILSAMPEESKEEEAFLHELTGPWDPSQEAHLRSLHTLLEHGIHCRPNVLLQLINNFMERVAQEKQYEELTKILWSLNARPELQALVKKKYAEVFRAQMLKDYSDEASENNPLMQALYNSDSQNARDLIHLIEFLPEDKKERYLLQAFHDDIGFNSGSSVFMIAARCSPQMLMPLVQAVPSRLREDILNMRNRDGKTVFHMLVEQNPEYLITFFNAISPMDSQDFPGFVDRVVAAYKGDRPDPEGFVGLLSHLSAYNFSNWLTLIESYLLGLRLEEKVALLDKINRFLPEGERKNLFKNHFIAIIQENQAKENLKPNLVGRNKLMQAIALSDSADAKHLLTELKFLTDKERFSLFTQNDHRAKNVLDLAIEHCSHMISPLLMAMPDAVKAHLFAKNKDPYWFDCIKKAQENLEEITKIGIPLYLCYLDQKTKRLERERKTASSTFRELHTNHLSDLEKFEKGRINAAQLTLGLQASHDKAYPVMAEQREIGGMILNILHNIIIALTLIGLAYNIYRGCRYGSNQFFPPIQTESVRQSEGLIMAMKRNCGVPSAS